MPRPGRRKLQALQPVNWLEIALRHWEDWCYLTRLSNQLRRSSGLPVLCRDTHSLVNYSQFRSFLLTANQVGLDGIQSRFLSDFRPPEGLPDAMAQYYSAIPMALAHWQRSRRIYRLDPDLQALLRSTSLKDVCWSDVELPFDTFAIQLAQPYDPGDGNLFHLIVVNATLRTSPSNPPLLSLRLIGTRGNEPPYTHVSEEDKTHIQSLISKGRLKDAAVKAAELTKKLDRFQIAGIGFERSPSQLVEEAAEREYKRQKQSGTNLDLRAYEAGQMMVRTIVGLILYLKSLPPGSPHCSPPVKPFRSGEPDLSIITNQWEVCDVTSVIPFTREERIYLGLAGTAEEQRVAKYELRIHFREGHWRRQPGQGSDPNAPRTVHVRPTIVRRDRMAPGGGLPGGTMKKND